MSARLARCLASMVLLGAGCDGGAVDVTQRDPGGSAGAPSRASDAPTDPASPAPQTAAGGSACTGRSPQPADAVWTLLHDGLERQFHVHVPRGYDPARPTPVVLNLPGLSETADMQEALTVMTPKADAAGFVVVYPSSVNLSWNAGTCCGYAAQNHVDDIGFVRAMLDDLEARLCVDARRVFVTGMSNGGMMSHRIACELADRVAAVAPVAGSLVVQTCTPARPISVMHFHGTADPLVPFTGWFPAIPVQAFPAVPDVLAGWAARDGCDASPLPFLQKDDTTCERWSGCRGATSVELCTVDGGGHTWPGGLPVPGLGKTTWAISATDMMWDFFREHPMPE
jgi:polyhydroxybutyrate depolymerase